VHVPLVAVQAPLQPAKTEPLLGVALSVTTVPALKLAEQVEGHKMMSGGWVLATVPDPAPFSATVSVKVCVAFIVVVAVAVLLVRFGSGVADVTVALLVSVPVAVAVTTRVIVAVAALFIVPRAHVTVVVPLHDPTVVADETNVAPAGNASVKVTAVAANGPLLTTVAV
jgi:hypothetical protein